MIMRETGGRGVDLVLNSLTEEKLLASVRCLAQDGRFLEIGKFDLTNNNQLGMEMFRKGIAFSGIMLDVIFDSDVNIRVLLQKVLNDAIKDGAVRPLTRTVFPLNEVEQAYRYMTAGKHIGKVLIKIREEEPMKKVIPSIKYLSARPRLYCDPNFTYVIVGGLGGFGLELADWLVLRGARKLLLSSRTGISTGYQRSRVHIWGGYGVTVCISTVDISTVDGITTLLNDANTLGPVGGIFNLAVVLHDAVLENQTEEKFHESMKTKGIATRHLDVLSRRMCPQLQHFVVFSSVSCGRGNAGQTNYGMANSVMERVCEARVRDGLPGLAIQWGAIGEVGLVAQMQEDDRELVIGGTLQQRIGSCLEVLDGFLKQSHPVVASMVVAEKRAGGKAGSILECVVNILGIRDVKTVIPTATLAELGMDSMTGVEIKQALEREYEVFLTPQEIRDLTVVRLNELAVSMAEREEGQAGAEMEPQLEGLHLFMSVIEEDCVEFPVMLTLPSLGGEGLTFLVPGIDGKGVFLKPLAGNLSGDVVALQLGHHNPGSSVHDMVNYLITHMRTRLRFGEPFRLVGYSFGGLLALELAKALEAMGHTGRLVLVDTSPDFLYGGAKALIPDDPALFEVSLLLHLLNLLEPITTNINDILREELQNLSSFDDRIRFLLAKYPNTKVTHEYVSYLINSTILRMRAILEYRWQHTHRLAIPVMLLRPTAAAITIDDDYRLPKYCQNLETRPFITGNHVTMVEHPDTAHHINEFLNRVTEPQKNVFSVVEEFVKTQPIVIDDAIHK